MLLKLNSHARWLCLITFIMFLAILGTTDQSKSISIAEKVNSMDSEETHTKPYELKYTAIDMQRLEKLIDIREAIKKTKDKTAKVQIASVDLDIEKSTQVEVLQTMVQSYKAVEVTATGYTPGRESTGKDPGHPQYGITYSGLKVIRDSTGLSTIAADLKVFPLGTVLYIPDYGYGVVADIGSAIKGNIIDLYFNTVEDVYNEWGKKTLDVYIVELGTGKMNEEIWKQKIEKYKS